MGFINQIITGGHHAVVLTRGVHLQSAPTTAQRRRRHARRKRRAGALDWAKSRWAAKFFRKPQQ